MSDVQELEIYRSRGDFARLFPGYRDRLREVVVVHVRGKFLSCRLFDSADGHLFDAPGGYLEEERYRIHSKPELLITVDDLLLWGRRFGKMEKEQVVE